MTKTASRPDTSKLPKNKPDAKLPRSTRDTPATGEPPDYNELDYMLIMTEEQGLQVRQARCMIELMEELAFSGQGQITVSRGALHVMLLLIRDKLTFKARLVSMDAAGFLREHGHK